MALCARDPACPLGDTPPVRLRGPGEATGCAFGGRCALGDHRSLFAGVAEGIWAQTGGQIVTILGDAGCRYRPTPIDPARRATKARA